MRPIERIDSITLLLDEIWRFDPDMRFMQLVYVLQSKFSAIQGGAGKVVEYDEHDSGRGGYDLFNIEDTNFESFLVEYLNDLKTSRS